MVLAVFWLMTACSHPSTSQLPSAASIGYAPTPTSTPLPYAPPFIVYNGEGFGCDASDVPLWVFNSPPIFIGSPGPLSSFAEVGPPAGHNNSTCLKIVFDSTTGDCELQFSGYCNLPSFGQCNTPQGNGITLSNHGYMDFWVKGQNGGESISMRVNDLTPGENQSNYIPVMGAYFLPPSGGITKGWQEVRVPLTLFIPGSGNPAVDLDCVGRIKFVGAPGVVETIYLDDWYIN